MDIITMIDALRLEREEVTEVIIVLERLRMGQGRRADFPHGWWLLNAATSARKQERAGGMRCFRTLTKWSRHTNRCSRGPGKSEELKAPGGTGQPSADRIVMTDRDRFLRNTQRT